MESNISCERNASGTAVIVLIPITLVTVVVLVSLRIYTRAKIVKCFGWDDFFILLATVSADLLQRLS